MLPFYDKGGTIQTGNKIITYTHDMDGIRVSKTVVTDTDTTRTTSQTQFALL